MNRSFRYISLFFVIAAIVGAIIFMGSGGYHSIPPGPARDFALHFNAYEYYDPPQPLPKIEMVDFDGKKLRMDQLTGKWRLLDFWASWCVPCLMEMPDLQALQASRGGDGFDIVFISLDDPVGPKYMQQKIREAGVPDTLHVYYVNDIGVWNKLGIRGVPTSIIIDPQGLARYRFVGNTDWTAQESLAFIDDLLKN